MFARMEALLKMYALLASVSRTQHIASWVETRPLARVSFLRLAQINSSPPSLYILTVPGWLSVNIHYFPIGPKVKKMFNTLTPLAPIHVTLFPMSSPV